MSSEKQKLDHRNVHIVVGRHFNVGGKYTSQYGTIATEVCEYTDTAAAVVGGPQDKLGAGYFDTTPKEWTAQTRRNGCGSWWH
jgi:hypothetical protein